MTEIEQKALALIAPGAACEVNFENISILARAFTSAIEQHEAFRQEVSDAVELANDRVKSLAGNTAFIVNHMQCFIIPAPKPDPLVDVLLEMDLSSDPEEGQHDAKWLRIKLDALGFEIREKNDDQ